jgi:hypothetical protein
MEKLSDQQLMLIMIKAGVELSTKHFPGRCG